jgi:hypothetical protein
MSPSNLAIDPWSGSDRNYRLEKLIIPRCQRDMRSLTTLFTKLNQHQEPE